MKVKELIEELQKCDPDADVLHTVQNGYSEDDIYGVRPQSGLFAEVVIY